MTETLDDRRSTSGLFWGRTADLSAPMRIATLLFVVIAIASMSFCQLGFWSIGIVDGRAVYVMLLLAPLAAGALLFGPLTGALLGLYTGIVVYAHSALLPLDFYEVYFMFPLSTCGTLTLLGLAMGFLFSRITRLGYRGGVRFALLGVVCLAASFVESILMLLVNVYYYSTTQYADQIGETLSSNVLGLVVQALINGVAMIVLCCVADVIVRKLHNQDDGRALMHVFRNWMIAVAAMVFMAASAIFFSAATIQSEHEHGKAMLSEVEYLQNQIAISDSRNFEELIEGYSVPIDGYVVIMDDTGTVMASDEREWFSPGDSFLQRIGWNNEYDDLEEFVTDISRETGPSIIDACDSKGNMTMELTFVEIGPFDGGYVAMLRDADMVHEGRFGIMLALTLLALALIASIAILATVLLDHVVVKRIDETNASLGKITNGDLNERVNARSSREFSSLSAGINKTVSALKDTIEEIKQHNAQDLATAKTIQESSLPRDFPPFPHIDRFDLYASMKTAKEVGGDFYDFFLIGEEEDKLGFVMADVSGKGIPAALFMMSAKTLIQDYMTAGLPVGDAIGAANHQLCIGNDAGMFVTAYACILDYRTGELSYVNAGHNPPLILHDGRWEWMKEVSGMPLGLFDGIPYDEYSRTLETEDTIYLYTDGVTEAMSVEGELFGEERLEEVLEKYSTLNARSISVGVRRALTDFTLDAEQSDDITMLCLKYGVPPEKKAVMVLDAIDTQLVHVCNFVHAELHRRGAPKSVYGQLDIAAEELFVNVCHYAYPDATPENPGEVRIGFEYDATVPALTVTISDDGVPFDPLAKPDAVTPDDIMDVPIGGLGILMAKQSVDELRYERVDGSNVVTLVKTW